MGKGVITVGKMKCVQALNTVLLATALLMLLSVQAYATVNIDGQILEPEWESAQRFIGFAVVDPWTRATPHLPTEARVSSLPEGLAVAFICTHPNGEVRTRTGTIPDARDFNSDFVSLLVDFDGTGDAAYEFSVSLAGSYRDGSITLQNDFNYDWDGIWEYAVHEETDRWIVEMLLPWSIVGMREGNGDTRQIGLCFRRGLTSINEISSFPALNPQELPFIGKFEKCKVSEYKTQHLDLSPYVTVLNDMLNDHITTKVGGDLFWKLNGKFQLSATFNPDFGQVESDELVINFSATETFFSDKRPFFTDNQSLFTVSIVPFDTIIHTRRIGGTADDGTGSSDINAAAKFMGTMNSFNYGLLAASEADDAGRNFYAGRVSTTFDNGSFGWLTTFVDRPFFDRTALVNAFDYNFTIDKLFIRGVFVRSDIEASSNDESGYAGYSMIEYQASKRLRLVGVQSYYDDTVDFNDMGYMMRNDLAETVVEAEFRQMDFPEVSTTSLITWTTRAFHRVNTSGDYLPSRFWLVRDQQLKSGASLQTSVNYMTAGYDDEISRGNGMVHQAARWNGNISYTTQRRGAWRKSIAFKVFQEGVSGWGYGIDGDVSWYPIENFTLDFEFSPSHSRDWLIWLREDQLASYSKTEVSVDMSATWFPADKHEIRMRSQWLVIDANARQGYRIGDDERLVPSNDVINDFAATSFGLQFRYRYELAPLSDLYLVYSRGGLDYIDNPDENTWHLLGTSTNLRDSDQILLKLRYRF